MSRSLRAGSLAFVLLCLVARASAQESWDAIYVNGVKVGYTHVRVEPVKSNSGKDLIRVRVDWEVTFKRGNDRSKMTLFYGTIEKPDGTILRLDTQTVAAENTLRTYGDVQDGVMPLTIEAGGNRQVEMVPWGPDVRGPYAAELSLARDPMTAGQVRELKTYIPDLNKVRRTRLSAKAIEPVAIGPKGQKRDLLRVEQVVLDDAGKPIPSMSSNLWVDTSGQILKSRTELLGGLETYRTTKAGALGEGNGEVELLENSILKTRKIPRAETTRRIVYRVKTKDEAAVEVFPNDRRQTATAGNSPDVATVEVLTAGKDVGEAGPTLVEPEFLRPNSLVNSDDPRVLAHMRKAVGTLTDPWQRAAAIESWVSQNIVDKNFATAFASASEVAKNLRGDCSEHSVLVAAMCRAAGIPARCVVGVVYADNLGGFGPHMWNEVYINRRWVALDAAYNQTDVDATHIKFSTTSLDGVAPFEAFLPVLKVFGNLKIEPIEIR